MANILLQRGQQQQVDVTYKLAGDQAIDFTQNGPFDAELVLRKKRGDNFMGSIIDVLRFGVTSGTAVSEADGRIRLDYADANSPNIQLEWNTAQASLLPNEAITVYGDLKITDLGVTPNQVTHHIRLTFDIVPEITS
tara:strand:- start:1 stop:411 length:411 start_codon:yes stop_codon:yes gene_type:complete